MNRTPKTYTRTGHAGKDLNYLFWGFCGVTVCAEVPVSNFFSVAVPTLENASHHTPKMAISTEPAASWAMFPDGLPKYDVLPPLN